jgi:hypothetical protein
MRLNFPADAAHKPPTFFAYRAWQKAVPLPVRGKWFFEQSRNHFGNHPSLHEAKRRNHVFDKAGNG